MSDVKREMIFGDESLFDGAPEDAEFAGWFCQEIRWYMIHDGLILFSDGGSWCTSDNPYISSDIAAMRRIIKPPVWTVADQKAGRLPDVGAEVMCMDNSLHEFVGESIHAGHWALRDGKTKKVFNTPAASVKPVETDEERAKREREEWCKKASFIIPSVTGGLISDLGCIHDALVSGELKMPEVQK